MKITIAYQAEEEKAVSSLLGSIRHQLGKVKIKHSDRHKPYRHIYVAKEPPAGGNPKKGA